MPKRWLGNLLAGARPTSPGAFQSNLGFYASEILFARPLIGCEAVGEFHREEVVTGRGKRAEHGAQAGRVPRRAGAGAVLLPDDIHGAARPILPSQHQVAAERAGVEVVIF